MKRWRRELELRMPIGKGWEVLWAAGLKIWGLISAGFKSMNGLQMTVNGRHNQVRQSVLNALSPKSGVFPFGENHRADPQTITRPQITIDRLMSYDHGRLSSQGRSSANP